MLSTRTAARRSCSTVGSLPNASKPSVHQTSDPRFTSVSSTLHPRSGHLILLSAGCSFLSRTISRGVAPLVSNFRIHRTFFVSTVDNCSCASAGDAHLDQISMGPRNGPSAKPLQEMATSPLTSTILPARALIPSSVCIASRRYKSGRGSLVSPPPTGQP